MDLVEPFSSRVDLREGLLGDGVIKLARRLSDLRGIFRDEKARAEMVVQVDPLVYEVFVAPAPESEGHLCHGVTVLHPGRVGDEYFMTKGHYHQRSEAAEVYYGLAGDGLMMLQTRWGLWRTVDIGPGTVVYVPPHWGHRSINTGDVPLILLFAYPGDAGHDYGTIESTGFARLVVADNGRPSVVENPRYIAEAPL
ncbi:MAG: cupin domain-containing protein [Armatimonadetes bacterium]|nr:cupin domain-containing protein [Armatimonadota bacterium]